jgi:transposase-like protein
MRYPASEKLEIIRTVDASHLPVKQTLAMLGIPSSTYYDWYARWVEGGVDALADRSPRPRSVWNRIPDDIREAFIDFALDHEDLTPRELAVKFTDEKRYFVSESSTYRILKAEDLITAPAHVVIRAADEFRDKTVRPNKLWQSASRLIITFSSPLSPRSISSSQPIWKRTRSKCWHSGLSSRMSP